jgi:hypothetical protein
MKYLAILLTLLLFTSCGSSGDDAGGTTDASGETITFDETDLLGDWEIIGLADDEAIEPEFIFSTFESNEEGDVVLVYCYIDSLGMDVADETTGATATWSLGADGTFSALVDYYDPEFGIGFSKSLDGLMSASKITISGSGESIIYDGSGNILNTIPGTFQGELVGSNG